MKLRRIKGVKMALSNAQKHELLIQFNNQRQREVSDYNDMKAT